MAASVRPAEERRQAAPTVSLVDADPDLTADIPEADLELARRVLTRPRYDIPKGRWSPEMLRGHDEGAFAILLIEGAVVRQLDVAERHSTQILGPGDVLQPPGTGGLLDCPVTWNAVVPSAVVVLDERFTRAGQRWPSLNVHLQRRLLDQADRTALHAAISQLPRVDARRRRRLLDSLRRELRFYPSDFTRRGRRLTADEVERLVEQGVIRVHA